MIPRTGLNEEAKTKERAICAESQRSVQRIANFNIARLTYQGALAVGFELIETKSSTFNHSKTHPISMLCRSRTSFWCSTGDTGEIDDDDHGEQNRSSEAYLVQGWPFPPEGVLIWTRWSSECNYPALFDYWLLTGGGVFFLIAQPPGCPSPMG